MSTSRKHTGSSTNNSKTINLPPLAQASKKTKKATTPMAIGLNLPRIKKRSQSSIVRRSKIVKSNISYDPIEQVGYHNIKPNNKSNNTPKCRESQAANSQHNMTIKPKLTSQFKEMHQIPNMHVLPPLNQRKSQQTKSIQQRKRKLVNRTLNSDLPEMHKNMCSFHLDMLAHKRFRSDSRATLYDINAPSHIIQNLTSIKPSKVDDVVNRLHQPERERTDLDEIPPISVNYLKQTTHKRRLTSMHDEFERLVDQLMDNSGLSKQIVKNIIIYARMLANPETLQIDDYIFAGELSSTFGISDSFMVNNIYNNIIFQNCKFLKNPYMTISQYSRVVCAFLSADLGCKADLVFDVYDMSHDGEISKYELKVLLKPTVVQMMQLYPHEFVDSEEEELDELIRWVLKLMDLDHNGSIDKDEFKHLVKYKDDMILQMLGPCLPEEIHLRNFREKITGKSGRDVALLFGGKRQSLLRIERPTKSFSNKQETLPNPFLFGHT